MLESLKTNNSKFQILLLALLAIQTAAHGQSKYPKVDYLHQTDTLPYYHGYAKANSISLSNNGNSMVVGGDFYGNSLRYGNFSKPNIDSLDESTHTAQTQFTDFFIAKVNPSNGNPLWVYSGGAKNPNAPHAESGKNETISRVCQDNVGNIYAIGTHQGEIEFQGTLIEHKFEHDDRDVFILKLNPNGKLIWYMYLDPAGGIDMHDNIFDAFCTKSGELIVGINNRTINIFKFSSAGDLLFENNITVISNSIKGVSLSPCSNSEFILSTTNIKIEKTTLSDTSIQPNGNVGLYRFSSKLKLIWSTFFEANYSYVARSNEFDEIWISFNRRKTTNSQNVDCFAKYDKNGIKIYEYETNNTTTKTTDIFVNKNGDLFTCGNYSNPETQVTFDLITLPYSQTSRNTGYANTFITKFNNNDKKFTWAINFHGWGNECSSFNLNSNDDVFFSVTNKFYDNLGKSYVYYNEDKFNYNIEGWYLGKLSNTLLNTKLHNQSNPPLIYPNPCKDEITIQSSFINERSIISIYNTKGNLMLQYNGDSTISTKSLKSGIYFLQISNNGISHTIRFVKE
jgi:hypothetical protein